MISFVMKVTANKYTHIHILRLPIMSEWLEKGIYTTWDVIDFDRLPYSQENTGERHNSKTKLLECGAFSAKIK